MTKRPMADVLVALPGEPTEYLRPDVVPHVGDRPLVV